MWHANFDSTLCRMKITIKKCDVSEILHKRNKIHELKAILGD